MEFDKCLDSELDTYFGEVEHKFLEEVGDAAVDTFHKVVLCRVELEQLIHKAGNMPEEYMDYLSKRPFQDNIQWGREALNQQLMASFGDHLGVQASFYCPDYRFIF
jgi:hypothetical protein